MKTYRQNLLEKISSSAKVKEYEKVLSQDYESLIDEFFPARQMENGWARVNSEGEEGRSRAFNTETGKWTSFADEHTEQGFISFLIHTRGWEGLRDFCKTRSTPLNLILLDQNRTPDYSPAHRWAESKGLELGGRFAYYDTDGFLLGVRIRFNNPKDGSKEFKLLSFRSACVVKDRIRKEGWRLDGDWGPLDPLYGLEKFHEIGKRQLVLCEGEKATDAANKLLGDQFFATTWGWGSASGTAKADWSLLPADAAVTLWPDKDDPGKKVAEKLAEKIKGLRVVDVWKCEELQNGDDLYDVPDTFRDTVLKMIADAASWSATKMDSGLRSRFIYVSQLGVFFDQRDGTQLDTQLFRKKHMVEVENLDEELLADPALVRVDSTGYYPGQPLIYKEIDARSGYLRSYINTWRANHLEAAEGDPENFLSHLEYLVPDANVRSFVLDYMAYLVQYPGEKVHFAPLIQGTPGTGKSYIAAMLRAIFGKHNVTEITTEEFKSDFSGWAEGSQVVIFEEVMTNGRRDLMNKIKPAITSETIRINKKNVQDWHAANRFNFFLFTNYRDAIVLDEGDRRFMVYYSPAQPKEEQYYIDLFNSIPEEAGQVLWMLTNRKLSSFNAKGVAPMTSDKKSLIESSRSDLFHVLKEAIDTAVMPFNHDLVQQPEILNYVRAHSSVRNPKAIGPILEQLGARSVGRVRSGNGQVMIWAVRNVAQYESIPQEALRELVKKPTE